MMRAAVRALLPCFVLHLCGCGSDEPAPAPFLFVDVTAASGVEFEHVNGAHGHRQLPETMGGSAAWFDLENDGDFDLFLGQSGELPGVDRGTSGRSAVFSNDGGRFRDVTATALPVADLGYGQGVAVGDVHGDGFEDVYVTNFGPNVLLSNRSGRLVDSTAELGGGDPSWSASAVFFDKEGDGDLDLFVTNYVEYDLRAALALSPRGEGFIAYPHPDRFRAAADVLYENDGAGHLRDVTRDAGIRDVDGKGLGVVAADLDLDGDQDLYVANDSTPNFLFRNQGDGTFVDVSSDSNAAYDVNGRTQAGMGVTVGDADLDGRFDLFVTNLDQETNTLYRQVDTLVFEDATLPRGLGVVSLPFVGFGTAFVDLDLDADEDLFVTNGHIIDNVETIQPGTPVTFLQRCLVFENDGKGVFGELGPRLAPALAQRRAGRALALCDVDGDLDLDALIAQNAASAVLLRNDGTRVGRPLCVHVVGRSGAPARGAVVEVSVDGQVQRRIVGQPGSYCAANDPRAFFGVSRDPEFVAIRWQDGARTELKGVPAGTAIRVGPDGGFVIEPTSR
ncbi:MAG: CRTAC1 family protein [Planctomycetes bacterium]|nr:CRTAC1 family protein [Planctomycetota bacterium]